MLSIVTGTRAKYVQHQTPSGVCPSGDQPCRIRTNLSILFFFVLSFFCVFVFICRSYVLIDILRLPRNRSEVSTPHLEYLNSIKHGPRKGGAVILLLLPGKDIIRVSNVSW